MRPSILGSNGTSPRSSSPWDDDWQLVEDPPTRLPPQLIAFRARACETRVPGSILDIFVGRLLLVGGGLNFDFRSPGNRRRLIAIPKHPFVVQHERVDGVSQGTNFPGFPLPLEQDAR